MAGFRSYLDTTHGLPDGSILLDRDESHHLIKVRRARLGDRVSVFDGTGNVWVGELVEAKSKTAQLKILSHERKLCPRYKVTLAQALPKGKTMDAIVQKATELGVGCIVPLITEHSEVRLSDSRADQKTGKWRTVAIEACKQSGNSFLPEITTPQTLSDYCGSLPEDSLRLVAALTPEAQSLKTVLSGTLPPEIVWLIGPEGDLSPQEYALAAESGFRPVTLGSHVLRADTAAIAALSILNYEIG